MHITFISFACLQLLSLRNRLNMVCERSSRIIKPSCDCRPGARSRIASGTGEKRPNADGLPDSLQHFDFWKNENLEEVKKKRRNGFIYIKRWTNCASRLTHKTKRKTLSLSLFLFFDELFIFSPVTHKRFVHLGRADRVRSVAVLEMNRSRTQKSSTHRSLHERSLD